MKYLSQITIIAAISLLGELLSYLIPLPIPGSIYGLVILFILLLTGVIKVHHVKDTGDFLLTLMPIMFVGPTVGLIENFDTCAEFALPIILTITLITFIVMAVTGTVAEALINRRSKSHRKGDSADA